MLHCTSHRSSHTNTLTEALFCGVCVYVCVSVCMSVCMSVCLVSLDVCARPNVLVRACACVRRRQTGGETAAAAFVCKFILFYSHSNICSIEGGSTACRRNQYKWHTGGEYVSKCVVAHCLNVVGDLVVRTRVCAHRRQSVHTHLCTNCTKKKSDWLR